MPGSAPTVPLTHSITPQTYVWRLDILVFGSPIRVRVSSRVVMVRGFRVRVVRVRVCIGFVKKDDGRSDLVKDPVGSPDLVSKGFHNTDPIHSPNSSITMTPL